MVILFLGFEPEYPLNFCQRNKKLPKMESLYYVEILRQAQDDNS